MPCSFWAALVACYPRRPKPGDRLTLERCGNDSCSVAAPVAEWTSENLERRGPTEVYTEGARYVFSAFTDGKGIVGARASIEKGVTTLHFTSGMSVGVEVRASR